jgi:hypothetical protein
MAQELSGAELVKRTSQLVAAYCETLKIDPAELPSLILYVGQVLGTPQEASKKAAPVTLSRRSARRAGQGPRPMEPRLAQIGSPSTTTNLVDLAAYRKGLPTSASGRLAR